MTTINHNHLKLIYYQLLLLPLLLGFLPPAQAGQPYIVSIAGTGQEGFAGDGGLATKARLNFPMGVAVDHLNNDIYFVQMNNHRVSKIDSSTGILTTVAGNGTPGGRGDDGPAIAARLDLPLSVAIDSVRRQLYIADTANNAIRQVDLTTGIITTLAGEGSFGDEGDGGPAKYAKLELPMGVAVNEKTGRVFIADTLNDRIRFVDDSNQDGKVTSEDTIDTMAGLNPTPTPNLGDGGLALNAYIEGPLSLVQDNEGNVYIADSMNLRVRKIDITTNLISTVGTINTVDNNGNGGYLCEIKTLQNTVRLTIPSGLAVDSQGNVYVSDLFHHVICKIDLMTNQLTAIAGTGFSGPSQDFQPAERVELSYPAYITIDSDDNLYLADGKNNKVRKIAGLRPSTDTTPPVITLASPQVGKALEGSGTISGTANDNGDGLGDVGIQVQIDTSEGKTLYLAEFNRFVDTPEWLYPTGKENWSYDISKINLPAGTCTVTARAFDKAGNFSDAKVEGLACSPPAHTELTLSVSSPTVLQKPNELFEVFGKLLRKPDIGINLAGQSIMVTLTNLETFTTKDCVVTTDDLANYLVTLPHPNCPAFIFDTPGKYSLQATFAGTTTLKNSNSLSQEVLVGQSAGYAILVQGSLPPNNEGMEAYNKTLNRIYRTLRFDRGLRDEDILYFNYSLTQTDKDIQVDGVPSKVAVKTALESLATSLNEVPAPLYVILVDHGNTEKLFVGNDVITPTDLNEWLTTLEGWLTNPFFAQHPFQEIIILGACYSGSFIPLLSKSNRVIITSAAANEVSYKGLKESDGIRSGEFFIEELFYGLGEGNTVADAFVSATWKTEVFTRSGLSATNFLNAYSDDAMQHPLLDDNGDKVGSNELMLDGDGLIAQTLSIGVGIGSQTNDSGPLTIVDYSKMLYLDETTTTATLFVEVNDPRQVDGAAIMEIRPPSKILTTQSGTGQVEIELENKPLTTFNQTNKHFERSYSGFTQCGKYEIFYTLRNAYTGAYVPTAHSVVYKQCPDNSPPQPFALRLPANGAKTQTYLNLVWDAALDFEKDPITYFVTIAKDPDFTQLVSPTWEVELTDTSLFIDYQAKLEDLTQYYWKVDAIDSRGARTTSETWTFSTDNHSAGYGCVNAEVKDYLSHADISNAVITLPPQCPNAGTSLCCELGEYDILVSAPGYISETHRIQIVDSQETPLNLDLECDPKTNACFGILQFSSPALEVYENQGTVEIPVGRINGNQFGVSVDYEAGDLGRGTLTWTDMVAGEQRFSLNIPNDNLFTGDREVVVTLSNVSPPNTATLGMSALKIIIREDDPKPLLNPPPLNAGVLQFVNDKVNVTEGGTVDVTVSRTGGSSGEVWVNCVVTGAVANDYGPLDCGTRLVWPEGETGNKTLTFTSVNNDKAEGEKTVILQLVNPTNSATLGYPQNLTVTIQDNDIRHPGVLQILPLVESFHLRENGGVAEIVVTRQNGSDGEVTITCSTQDGTAIANEDYTPMQETLFWPAGDSSERKCHFSTVRPDEETEENETVKIVLSNPTGGATLGSLNFMEVTIEDVPPVKAAIPQPGKLQFKSNSYQVNEQSVTVTVEVERVEGFDGEVSGTYATNNEGSAIANLDYTPVSNTLLWADKEGGVKTFTVPILADDVVDGPKVVIVTLSEPKGGASLGMPERAEVGIADMTPNPPPNTSSGNGETPPVDKGGQPPPPGTDGDTSELPSTDGNGGGTSGSESSPGVPGPGVPPKGSETPPTGVPPIVPPPTGTLQFVPNEYRFPEGSIASVQVTRIDGTGDITVSCTALKATEDYQPMEMTLFWKEGESGEKSCTVQLLSDDLTEENETFTLTLTVLTEGATLGIPQTVTVTILDVPPPPPVSPPPPPPSVTTVQFTQANYGAVTEDADEITLAVSRQIKEGSCEGEVTVEYLPAPESTAMFDSDYQNGNGTLQWADGVCDTQLIHLWITDDSDVEGKETILLRLVNPTGAKLGELSQVEVSIEDNDIPPPPPEEPPKPGTVQFSQVSYSANEGETSVPVTVIRENGEAGEISVLVTGPDGTQEELTWGDGDNEAKRVEIPVEAGVSPITLSLSEETGEAEVGPRNQAVVIPPAMPPTPPEPPPSPLPPKSSLPDCQQGVAKTPEGQEVDTQAAFHCGIAVNGEEFLLKEIVNLSDMADIQGEVTISPEDVGEEAEIVIYAHYRPTHGDAPLCFMLDSIPPEKDYHISPCDLNNPASLAGVKRITLGETVAVDLYQGHFIAPGELDIYFGYRVLKDGRVVVNGRPIEVVIY